MTDHPDQCSFLLRHNSERSVILRAFCHSEQREESHGEQRTRCVSVLAAAFKLMTSLHNVTDVKPVLTKYLVGAVVCATAWGCHVHAFAGEAADVVTELQQSLITIMREGTDLGYTGRYRTIAPIVDKTHDIDNVARLVVGRHWKKLTADQRATFVRTFRDLSISTYAGRFKGYDGEQFTVRSERSLKRGKRKLVVTHFVKSDGETIQFHYVLHQVNEQWKIISVTVNGVSDLALKRAEYGGILKNEGFSALIERLQTQIRDSANGL